VPYSYQTFAGGFAGLNLAVSIPFLLRDHISLYTNYNSYDGTYDRLLVVGTDYGWISDTQIQLLASAFNITVKRKTPTTELLVSWTDGSNVDMDDLLTADRQNLYAVQEQEDSSVQQIANSGAILDQLDDVLPYTLVGTVATIPTAPTNGQRIEIGNSTGIQSFSPLTGRPSTFIGATNLTVRLVYSAAGTTWQWVDYRAVDPDGRYAGINFTQSGTGAIARTINSKLRDVVISVKDFGAVGDGTTNDTAAFTAAVASTTATIVGIYVPPGNYKLPTSPSIGSKTVTWFFAQGAFTNNGSGDIGAALPGSVVSNSVYWQPWAAGGSQVLGGPYGYMGSTSLTTAYPAHGRLGFTSLGNPTANADGATIGFSSGMINQTPSGTAKSSTWNFYGSTVAASASSNATAQCIELDIAAMAGSTGKTYGLVIAAGGEIADPATYSATKSFKSVDTAIQISPNGDVRYANLNFINGLLIQGSAISPTLNNAIYLGFGHAIRWANTSSAFVGQISCSATTSAQAVWLNMDSDGAAFSTLTNNGLFRIKNSPSTGSTTNFLEVSPGINTGNSPEFRAQGGDANVDITLAPKGTGAVQILTGGFTGSAGSLNGYLPLRVNGTLFKVPLYNL